MIKKIKLWGNGGDYMETPTVKPMGIECIACAACVACVICGGGALAIGTMALSAINFGT